MSEHSWEEREAEIKLNFAARITPWFLEAHPDADVAALLRIAVVDAIEATAVLGRERALACVQDTAGWDAALRAAQEDEKARYG